MGSLSKPQRAEASRHAGRLPEFAVRLPDVRIGAPWEGETAIPFEVRP